MTGKDLVLFIVKHDLLDVEINQNIDEIFLSLEEAAIKMGISTTSLQDMIKLGMIDYIKFDDQIYLDKNIQLKSLKRRNYE